MLIKLTPSILNNNSEYFLLALENLALAMRERKHLVVATTKTLQAIIKHPQFEELGTNSQGIYRELFTNNENYEAYLSYVSLYIEVIEPCLDPVKKTPKTPNDKTIIQVPLSFFQDSEIIQKTILLCENQEDTKFYEIIGRVYRQWKKFNVINFDFTPQGGGGSTIASEYESIQSRKDRFCLCIVDSDKLSPNSSYGKTAKGLLDKHNSDSVTTELYILKVREAENLIPSSILLELFSNDRNREKAYQILIEIEQSSVSDIRPYLDIKQGTLLKSLLSQEDNVKLFWQNKLKQIPNIDSRIDNNCIENWKCNNSQQCQCLIANSFGNETLSNTLQWINQTSHRQIFQKIQNDQLLSSEWETMGQILLNWCITGVRVRA